jgi:hypothetical protein
MKKVKIGNRHHFVNVFAADEILRQREEIDRLEKIAKVADLVSSMSSYDEDVGEVDPCHMVYFEELEDALIPWRESKGRNDRE